jgi:hypothetical protein
VFRENVFEEDPNRMPEDDGVGDLHHGRFHVQGKKHALLFRVLNLCPEEVDEGRLAHERGVQDLTCQQRKRLHQDGDGPIVCHVLDACGRRGR